MKSTLLASFALAVGLIVPAVAQTPVPPVPAAVPATHGKRVFGPVIAVDTATKTVTVQERNATTPTTFTLGPDAAISKMTPAAVTDIVTGNHVRVNGMVTGTTVDARNITILPAGSQGRTRGRTVIGTVATVTPSLTVAGTDGQTYTVSTATTRVMKITTGAASDITVGARINARVNGGDPAKLVASQVNILPGRVGGRVRGRIGRRHRRAAPATP